MNTASTFVLEDDFARVEVAPEAGAAVVSYDIKRGNETYPVLVNAAHAASAGLPRTAMMAHGSSIMLPWCNRISGGGFFVDSADGQRWCALAPTLEGEALPIHGTAGLLPWRLLHTDGTIALCQLAVAQSDGEAGLYAYEAWHYFVLEKGALSQFLRVRNKSAHTLPYGFGFHPWFLRTPLSRLSADVSGVWLSAAQRLPLEHAFLDAARAYDIRGEKNLSAEGLSALPGRGFDHCFTGFGGKATLVLPEYGMGIALTADPVFSCLMVYAPPAANVICLEPMTHSVDAFNHKGQAHHVYPAVLAPRAEAMGGMVLAPFDLG